MSIEKPISTIKKAIQGRAEEKAYEDSLDRPEQKHYDESLNFYKQMRDKRPEEIEKLILHSADSKELRDKMGMELYKIFDQTWKEKTKGFFLKMIERASEVKENEELSRREFVKEMDSFAEKLLKETSEELRSDPRIISAFLGKEDILNKIIDYGITTTIYEARSF